MVSVQASLGGVILGGSHSKEGSFLGGVNLGRSQSWVGSVFGGVNPFYGWSMGSAGLVDWLDDIDSWYGRLVWADSNVWSSAVMKGQGKREIPEKTHRRAASSSTIPTCKNPGVTRPGIEPGSPKSQASRLTTVATVALPLKRQTHSPEARLHPTETKTRWRYDTSSGYRSTHQSFLGEVYHFWANLVPMPASEIAVKSHQPPAATLPIPEQTRRHKHSSSCRSAAFLLSCCTNNEHKLVAKTKEMIQPISLLAFHKGEPGSIPGRVTGLSQVGILPDDAVGRRVFSGISRFPHPFIPGLRRVRSVLLFVDEKVVAAGGRDALPRFKVIAETYLPSPSCCVRSLESPLQTNAASSGRAPPLWPRRARPGPAVCPSRSLSTLPTRYILPLPLAFRSPVVAPPRERLAPSVTDISPAVEKRTRRTMKAECEGEPDGLPFPSPFRSAKVTLSPYSVFTHKRRGAAVAERLARSPPTIANRVQSPAGLPDFRTWESCRTMPLVGGFSRGSPVSPTLSFRRCSILTSIILIGSQDHADNFPANQDRDFCDVHVTKVIRAKRFTNQNVSKPPSAWCIGSSCADFLRINKQGKDGAAPECKGGGKREIPEKTALTSGIVRHDSHVRKSVSDPAWSRAWLALVGGEQSDRYTTAAPRKRRAKEAQLKHTSLDMMNLQTVFTGTTSVIGARESCHALQHSGPIRDFSRYSWRVLNGRDVRISDRLREALGTGLVSDWLLYTSKRLPIDWTAV
ncbi:hypothetical protein PR048_024032 [Dryococelus australis]|uniref:Uncharacterized protein n=1 Tax=Dryococelus australis TaxID=614101 RepID=A0ABQ9GVT2_9NEOP|nr:hypothetical protein PR048_024032 [Dryococelus australis]